MRQLNATRGVYFVVNAGGDSDAEWAQPFTRVLIRASEGNRTKAIEFLERVKVVGGGTNPMPALRFAFRQKPELIYFLTDGEFNNIVSYEHVIDVTGVSSMRGSATIAATLYKETDESRKAREAMSAHVRAMNANTGYESGRPTKKDRRDIEKVRRRGLP